MGILRSSPDTKINSFSQQFGRCNLYGASVCGWQHFMEDYVFSFQFNRSVKIIGILDGQAGPQAAQFCHNQIPQILRACDLMKLQQYQAAIQNLCFTLDEKIKQNHQKINKIRVQKGLPQLPKQQHTPSQASLLICIIDDQSITIGNLGQCRSYVSYKYSQQKAVLISGNHIIQRDEDTENITKKGGFVIDNMINGKYLFTKKLGNIKYKNFDNQSKSLFSSQASIFSLRLQDIHMVIMGSSGLWERSQLILKQFLNKNKNMNKIDYNAKINDLLLQLVAQSPEEDYGKRNMSIMVLLIRQF